MTDNARRSMHHRRIAESLVGLDALPGSSHYLLDPGDIPTTNEQAIGHAVASMVYAMADWCMLLAPPLQCPKCGHTKSFAYEETFTRSYAIISAGRDEDGHVMISHVETDDADEQETGDDAFVCGKCDHHFELPSRDFSRYAGTRGTRRAVVLQTRYEDV